MLNSIQMVRKLSWKYRTEIQTKLLFLEDSNKIKIKNMGSDERIEPPWDLPWKMIIKKVDLFDETKKANKFNFSFTSVGKSLVSKIPNASIPFE